MSSELPDLSYLYKTLQWSYMAMAPGESYVETDNRSYISNSFGHRGPEFSGGVDALIVGCSITYGIGLDVEDTWGHLVASKLGYSYNLMGFPGGSIAKIVRQIFEYIETVGVPKRIFALMPEPRRVDLFEINPNQSDRLLANANPMRLKLNRLEDAIYVEPKTSKLLYDVDYTSLVSVNSIYLLERLCSFLKIDLMWTTWDSELLLETYKSFPSFFELGTENGDIFNKPTSCHSGDDPTFYIASDNDHWGSHYHIHVAEDFLNAIELSNAI